MSKLIASEQQAERIGVKITAGKRGQDFQVFWYEQPGTRLTLFSIRIIATGETITRS